MQQIISEQSVNDQSAVVSKSDPADLDITQRVALQIMRVRECWYMLLSPILGGESDTHMNGNVSGLLYEMHSQATLLKRMAEADQVQLFPKAQQAVDMFATDDEILRAPNWWIDNNVIYPKTFHQ
ncbi:hypothetical protein HY469_02015 [Candidatus Roizmanbacteria bacterium]|nr:hypothetical protein [Candidatus Roizmanbacteria bacterium]